jgi:L-ascorbate metabolism protein UlaG (beta-lactamase superfamily)
MIEPLLADDAFLADVQAASSDPKTLHIWWLGQSGFLVRWKEHFLLFDPYLSDSLTRKYHGTDKPHVRLTRRVVAPEKLSFVEIVTSTHNHTDHLDADTIQPLRAANPALRLVIPEANREFVAGRLRCDLAWPIGLDDGLQATVGPFAFHGIASAHETLDRDDAGRHRYLGYVVRVANWTLYHPGDCVPYPGLADKLRSFAIDIAFLPINGRDPKRGVPGNFDGREAAELARDAGIGLVVPCHYDLFEFNTVRPDLFVRSCAELGVAHRLLRAGERLCLSAM